MATFTLYAEDERPAIEKLAEALAIHRWSFGTEARWVIASPIDAAELKASDPPVEIRDRSYCARHTYVVGRGAYRYE